VTRRPELVALGWATVDIERAAAGWPAAAIRALPDDPHLGARVVRVDGVDRIVLLEPVTEGRLAASLARFGEGPVAVYLRPPGTASGRHSAIELGPTADGPFGRQALLGGAQRFGPHVVAILGAPPADTIDP
jgi:hypothetical protein